MTRHETSEDELDRLMGRIRAEIAEQDRRAAASPQLDASPTDAAAPAPPAGDRKGGSVRLSKLLRREDEAAFVETCFRAILGRPPDAGEAAYHRDRLRDGRLRKLGLIEELRSSAAGRERGVRIKGLRARRLLAGIGRVPGVAAVAGLARLPRLARNVHRVRRQTEQLNQAVGRLPTELSGHLGGVPRDLARLGEDVAGVRRELSESLRELRAGRDDAVGRALARVLDERLARQRDEFAGRLEQLERGLRTLHAAVEGGNGPLLGRLDELGERVIVVQRALAGRPAGSRAEPVDQAAEPGPDGGGGGTDALYAAFEDCFRGSRADIRQRQAAHLDLLDGQGERLGDLRVVDLGCGRGEWLELLRERSIRAVGVDRNRVFLADNVARGLEVVDADALAYLRGLPDGSVRAVTGFHLIEHLPFDVVLALLDESLRVLAEGGLVLFETPNPENLVTAAHRFYYDPTHRHPIPPEVAAFLLRARGYRDVALRRLHENADPAREGVTDGVVRALLFGPQDYAVVGYR